VRDCPVCNEPSEKATLFLDENIDQSRISGFSYASRKEPEYMCHKLMRCNTCDLVYVSAPPAQEELAHAYHVADYDSSDEANDAALSYMQAMKVLLKNLPNKQAGFNELIGVEPSSAAIAAAPNHRKTWLREGIFREKDFEPASIDLICCFMTMEHVQDPMETAKAALKLLRPGGAFVTVTHDYRSLVNRALGKRSPIIDIEHMQLFSNASISALFQRAGYERISAEPFINRYAMSYWLRLAPLPRPIKPIAKSIITALGIDKAKLGISVGNTLAVGYR
jgi:SAM-dependent methyltransferase